MARKNIFQLLDDKIDYFVEMKRIDNLLQNKKGIKVVFEPDILSGEIYGDTKFYSIQTFVDICSFKSWKYRNRCTSCKDMYDYLGFNKFFAYDCVITDFDFLNYLEYALNILNLTNDIKLENIEKYVKTDVYSALKSNINSCLNHLNFEAKSVKNGQMILVVQKNAAATAVAEISNEQLADAIIMYNHYLLNGDIEAKKELLLKLANDIEPKRKYLHNIDSKLEDGIFYCLNNMNIRHNNRSKKDKNYKEYVAKMKKAKLEEWYDELYQMILLAYLEIDQQERNERVKELKSNIEEAKTQG